MPPRVLLLGGHGKVSLLMTPKLLARSWHVTSVIRDASQTEDITSLGKGQPGEISVLVRSLSNVKSDEDAQKILDEVKPNYVIWCAGAGGKGGPENTRAIDRDACIHITTASLQTPSVSKFLLVSALSSRRERAPWWNDEDWGRTLRMREAIPVYQEAKLAADEHLTRLARSKAHVQCIDFRPGGLLDEPEKGKVSLGKTHTGGGISRADVAEVAVRLLERDDTTGWIDLNGGDDPIDDAISKVVSGKVDCIEGEPELD